MVGAAPDRGTALGVCACAGAYRHARSILRPRDRGGPIAPRPRRRPPLSRQPPPRRWWRLMTAPRVQLADELLRSFAATLRSAQLYSKGHPIITRNLGSFSAAIQLLHTLTSRIVIGLI